MRPASSSRIGRRVIVALALAAAVGSLAACSEPVPNRSELVEALRTSGVPKAQAKCVLDAVDGTLDAEELRSIVERGISGAPANDPAVSGEDADRLSEAMTKCRTPVTTTTTTTAPVDSADPADAVTTTTAANSASLETTEPN